MKRYDCTPQGMSDHTWGYWVRYTDAQQHAGTYKMHLDRALDLAEIAAHKATDLQRQLAEVIRERDTLKVMVELHDALNDRRRAIADNERRGFRK